MRTLFLCLILAGLAWIIQSVAYPRAATAVYLGLVAVVSLASVQVARRLALPAHLGPLVTGFALGPVGLLPGPLVDAIRPFSDLGSVWLGLYLGSAITPSVLLNKRSVYAALATVAAPACTTALLFLVFYQGGALHAFQLAFVSAIAAPLLTYLSSPDRRGALAFSLLVSGLALLLWSALQIFETPEPGFLLRGLRDILLWLAVVELAYRTLLRLRTATGLYIFYGIFTFFLYAAALWRGLTPLFPALATGLLLSIRCGKNRDTLAVLPGLSALLAPFVIASFVARLDIGGLHLLNAFHWQLLVAYTLVMFLGKLAGGLAALRFTPQPPRDWVQVFPQGVLAAILLPPSLPSSWFPQSPSSIVAAFLIFQGVVIPLLFLPIRALMAHLDAAGSEAD